MRSANDVVALDAHVGVGGEQHHQRDCHQPAEHCQYANKVEAGSGQGEGEELSDVAGQGGPGRLHSGDAVHPLINGEVHRIVEEEGRNDARNNTQERPHVRGDRSEKSREKARTEVRESEQVTPGQGPSGCHLDRHVSGHDTSEEADSEGDVCSEGNSQAEAVLLSVDIVVSLNSEAGKNCPQAHPHNENERILLELGPRPGHAVTDTQQRASHRACRIGRHPSAGTHTGLRAVARHLTRLGTVARSGRGLGSIAGLLLRVGAGPVAGLCPVARNAPGLGTVVWVT